MPKLQYYEIKPLTKTLILLLRDERPANIYTKDVNEHVIMSAACATFVSLAEINMIYLVY